MLLRFEPMRADDLAWVADQERQLHASPWSEKSFADALCAGYQCWMAWQAEQRVAYAVVMLAVDEAELLNISVVREMQGQGFATRLLQHVAQAAYAAGARHLFLEVRPSNSAACALYVKFGFREIARRKAYYPPLPSTAGREDALIMRCDLLTNSD